jgi:hypothetical protein
LREFRLFYSVWTAPWQFGFLQKETLDSHDSLTLFSPSW